MPCLYMCLTHAFVVRNAPSRWMAMIFFQSAKGKSSIGCTIWMPALETRMSTVPNVATVFSTPGVDLVLVAHVHGDRDRVLLAAELLRRGLRCVEVEVGDDDAPAGGDVALGDAVADAACGTRDEGDFAVEFHDARSFLGFR